MLISFYNSFRSEIGLAENQAKFYTVSDLEMPGLWGILLSEFGFAGFFVGIWIRQIYGLMDSVQSEQLF